MFTLYQYQDAYDNFMAGLDTKFRAAVKQRLHRLAKLGAKAGPKVTKHLRDGILECRAQRNRQQARLLYFYLKGRKIIVSSALIKEGKIPAAEIDRAISIKNTLEQNPELLDELTEIH